MSDIREKIVKLLALSESSNPAEAEAALMKARALMIQHQLEEEDLASSRPSVTPEVNIEEVPNCTEGYKVEQRPVWEDVLASIIGKAFSCRIVTNRSRIFFYGVNEDSKVAATVYAELRERIKIMAYVATGKHTEEYKKLYGLSSMRGVSGRNHPKTWRTAYVVGVTDGIRSKLAYQEQQDAPQTAALVLRRDQIVKSHIDTLPIRKRTIGMTSANGNAYAKGVEDGKAMEIKAKKQIAG